MENQELAGADAIVALAPPHIEGFWRCLDTVARERRYLAMTAAPDLDATRAFVEANRADGAPAFVALSAGEVAGWCDATRPPYEGWGHVGRLGLGVHPVHRGRGLGRALLAATIADARLRGFERLELEVFASNRPARSLYESAGFVTEGVRVRARKLQGLYDDAILMALLLA